MTPTQTADLVRLRELAQKATSGPWNARYAVSIPSRNQAATVEMKIEDAAYIKAASPSVVLELLDALEAAHAEGYRKGVLDCIAIAKAQPYFLDTKVGKRQEWVKCEIEDKCRALLGGQ